MKLSMFLVLALSLAACGSSSSSSSEEPAPEPSGEATSGGEPVDSPGAQREVITADECTARGGVVVGDIGDGAIHRPDYVCPTGAAPLANVPLGIEGSVCCGS